MTEEWRPVTGWPGYSVSSHGRVRGPRGRVLKTKLSRGYPAVSLTRQRKEYVHRLVLEAFVGPCPEGMQGAHGDGDRTNNRLTNLRWATPKENNADKHMHGTAQQGERHGHAKLTDAMVREARRLRREQGAKLAELARKCGVSLPTMSEALSGKSWRHV